MTPGVTVRQARHDEGELLGKVGFHSWVESAFAHQDAGRVDRAKLQDEFVQFCRDRFEHVSVAEQGGRVLGWGAREHADERITDLWVGPEAQGRGVGSALLAAMEADIARAGFGRAVLETHALNEGAIRFYERHGYVLVGQGETFSASLGYAIDKVGFCQDLENRYRN